MTQTMLEPAKQMEPMPMPQDEGLYEFVDGEWVEKEPMSKLATFVSTQLTIELGIYLKSRPTMGAVLCEGMFLLENSDGQKRRPDVAFLSAERYSIHAIADPVGDFPIPPNIAIEVISTHDYADDVYDKKREYLNHGVEEVWIVYCIAKEIEAYTKIGGYRTFNLKDVLCTDLLPGFEIPVSSLFPKV